MIPLSTTTISVLRLPDAHGYDEPYAGPVEANRTVVATGVRAVLDHPSGSTQVAGGVQAIEDYQLICDATPVGYLDLIRDDATGRVYRITWLMAYPEHVEAGLRAVEGES